MRTACRLRRCRQPIGEARLGLTSPLASLLTVTQLAAGLMVDPTRLKVLFALVPMAVTAAMQTTMIRANITAYSTAVGPSSALRKRTIGRRIEFMDGLLNLSVWGIRLPRK